MNTLIIKGNPGEVMNIVRKLRSNGYLQGQDFNFNSSKVDVGYEFTFKSDEAYKYAQKLEMFLQLTKENNSSSRGFFYCPYIPTISYNETK